jgi:hypothetical protein
LNNILQTGEFPDRLKFSEVKPLYKKGDKRQFSIYRPISLLPTFSKIIEEIICKRLYSDLNENNILVAEEFGFRRKPINTNGNLYTLQQYIAIPKQRKSCRWVILRPTKGL